MNILLYLKHFPASGAPLNSGTCTAVHGLALGLVGHGAEVSVLCEGETDSARVAEAGYRILCFCNPAPYLSFTVARGLRDFLAQCQPEQTIGILNGIFHPAVYAVSRVFRKLGIPYIAAPHDPYDPHIFSHNAHLKWPYWYLVERRLLQQACAIQLLDRRHEKALRDRGVKTAVIDAPNGYSPAEVPLESSLKFRINGPIRLLFLGRLDTYNKGLDLLIAAFARFAADHNARLTLQGPDWEGQRTKIEALIESYGLSNKAEVLPPDFTGNAPSIIARYDIFCLPSRFEGFGLSALQAMLAGRVLLVGKSAGIAPHVEGSECGVMVSPDISAIEEGLCTLVQRRREWMNMGLSGRAHALSRLNWNGIAGDLLPQYERLAA